MNGLSRRDALKLGVLGTAVGTLSGCARMANRFAEHHYDAQLPLGKTDETLRLIDRMTFGPTPGLVAKVKQMGRDAYIESLLNVDDHEDLHLQFLVNRFDVFQMDPYETRDLPEGEILRQLQAAAILRAVYGRHQLRERMVDFWTNHFNIYGRKGLSANRKAVDETQVVRKHALGSFPEMLKASAHSSAMLIYLDNQSNVSGHPNENYAREILELHSLGVKGGYSQKDVQEVARCFTGWAVERRFLHHRWAFRFDETLHDNGAKHVLGHLISAGGGEHDVDRVLEILAHHPSTARHIATKICRYFLGSDGDAWVDRTAATYHQTKGDIKALLKPILMSDDLLKSPPILKRPFDYAISAMRAVDADTDGNIPLQNHLASMGEALYQWPMPDGYPTQTSSWTGTMLPRWNFAYALAANQIGGTNVDWHALNPDRSAERHFELVHNRHPEPSDRVLTDKVGHELHVGDDGPSNAGFLCLASPAFQWR